MSVVLRQQFSGDPGLFGFLGKVAKSVTGAVSQLGIPGISGVAGFASRLLPGGRGSPAQRIIPGAGRTLAVPSGGVTLGFAQDTRPAGPSKGTALQRFLPGGATGVQTIITPADTAGIAPRGMRLNKTGYFRTDPNTGNTIFIAPETIWVKTRRRNPGNSRANDRAISRITGAKRMAKHLGRISIREKC